VRFMCIALVMMAGLALPRDTSASVIEIRFEEELSFDLGLTTASLTGDSFRRIEIDGIEVFAPGTFNDFEGDVVLRSGPLTNLTVSASTACIDMESARF
jgi:hypothetical protein